MSCSLTSKYVDFKTDADGKVIEDEDGNPVPKQGAVTVQVHEGKVLARSVDGAELYENEDGSYCVHASGGAKIFEAEPVA